MKVNVISLNETSYFRIAEEDKPYIKEIRSIYAYNPESCTHLCELTPSYELIFLHTYIVWRGEPNEHKCGELDEAYCYEGGCDTYRHVSDVRSFVKNNPTMAKECGEFEDMDAACEYLNGNWPL
jgi:hypothetical protein